jgi:hypothetical protein
MDHIDAAQGLNSQHVSFLDPVLRGVLARLGHDPNDPEVIEAISLEASSQLCLAILPGSGERCSRKRLEGELFCHWHLGRKAVQESATVYPLGDLLGLAVQDVRRIERLLVAALASLGLEPGTPPAGDS